MHKLDRRMTRKVGKYYDQEDDLNGDGVIDDFENDVKVTKLKGQIQGNFEEYVKNDYLQKFRREVDFHHKVFYRFEKAYRLGKKQPHKK